MVLPARGLSDLGMGGYQTEQPMFGKVFVGPAKVGEATALTTEEREVQLATAAGRGASTPPDAEVSGRGEPPGTAAVGGSGQPLTLSPSPARGQGCDASRGSGAFFVQATLSTRLGSA